MSEESNNPNAPDLPDPSSIQEILHKVIIAHQQSLALLQQTEVAYSRLIPHQLLTLLQAKSIVDVKLGDQVERKMTILFSDIRDFTPLSESMTPAENFEFINSYLSQMEPVISRHHGIIDKFIGDAIMALFEKGADDALNGAIAMLSRLSYYNEGRKRAGYTPIHIGIGLNTGMVMIGTVGGLNRMDSTVIGDAVNLAARLEEVTKTYNTPLIISQNTLYDLNNPAQFHIRFLDRIRVKGKSQPLSLYEVFDDDPVELRQAKDETLLIFEQAVAYYHLKEITSAIPLFIRCTNLCPGDLSAHIYLERCYEFQVTQKHQGTSELDTPIVWKTEYQTDNADLDNAHHALLTQINQYLELIQRNELHKDGGIFDFLREYTHTIFPIEERLMEGHAYPFAQSHAREHARFIDLFSDLEMQMKSHSGSPRYLAYRTALLLLDWFASHATKADRHFARHLQHNSSK